jgi:hypothetical protein
MAGNVYNITAEQGSTFVLQFDIKTDGTAWNLTGYSARMQVRSAPSSSVKILNLVSPTDITLTSLGVVTVTVSATTMATVAAGKWVYDLELVSPSGIVEKPLKGNFIVQAEVTK